MYRKFIAICLSVLLAATILIVMVVRVWDDLANALAYVQPLFLIPACFICLFAWGVRGSRYQAILTRMQVRISFIFGVACIFISQTVNLIVPARLGDLIRVVLLKHDYDATISQGLSSIVVERVFDIISVAILGLCAVVFVLNVPPWIRMLLIIPLVLGGIFFLVLLLTGTVRTRNKYIQYILTMLDEMRKASLTPRSALILGATSILIWILDTLICYLVAVMFRQEIPFEVVLLAVVAGNLVKAVPLTPGGVGTYEFALAVIFELAGTAPAVSTLIAVIDHLIKNGITLIGGALSILYLGDWVIPELSASIKKRLRDE
ncbi:lysylphosphatidylglycerol synthase transmembrane domain-containing protein [Methanospirillum sp.]